jgi:hypothetical protein
VSVWGRAGVAMEGGQYVRTPVELLLGALSVVALPLVRGDGDEEMVETAQFYGYEDYGDRFLNTWPRVCELTAFRPTGDETGCVVEMHFPGFVLPGAFSRACGRWAKAMRLSPAGRNVWRGERLLLTLAVSRHRMRLGDLRAWLMPPGKARPVDFRGHVRTVLAPVADEADEADEA